MPQTSMKLLMAARKTSRLRRRLTPAAAIVVFVLLGILETLVALALFQRADDHAYFLSVANMGISAVIDTGNVDYDLKAKVVAAVFYILVSPVRLLGGGEIAYLLWLRVLTLLGFLCAFEAVRRMVPANLADLRGKIARIHFMALCLLYPGQLAWTASLLRDGIGCALLFAAMLAWMKRWRLSAVLLLLLSLTQRPEFVVIAALLVGARLLPSRLLPSRRRGLVLLAAMVALSLLLFEPRQAASNFALVAWGEDGVAYPAISHMFDLRGYLLVFLQGLIDPLSVGTPTKLTPLGLAETVFFVWLLIRGLQRFARVWNRTASLYMCMFLSLWLFAYFEIFVGGYTRHRLAFVVLLLALQACTASAAKPPSRHT